MVTAELTDEKETLFIPLSGKALDYRSKNSILNDFKANEIIEKVGINFTKQNGFKAKMGGRTLAVRAKQYDEWTKDFITKNKNAVIVHLGCGLDARINRVQPPNSVTWFDVDSRIKSVYVKKLPMGAKLILGALSLSSKYQNMMRLLRYNFKR